MFVKLHKLNLRHDGNHYLTEVRLNVSHILYISENTDMQVQLSEGKIGLDLHPNTKFSNISVSGKNFTENIIVIGDPSLIESKVNKPYRQLLRG